MKKIIVPILLFFMFETIAKAEEIPVNAKSAILIEESTGKVLFEKNADEQLNPASMTKIMSLILIYEAIDEGKISLNDDVTISKDASNMGGSQVYINEGEIYKVEELLKGVAIASANDAVVALAEKVCGSKEVFVNKMNEKAKNLGLKNTSFVNPHGLDADKHYSSARDMSIMARELLKHEDILKYTSKYEDYFKKKDGSSIWLVNTNKLVRFYKGMDGLKTGYTSIAGYCLTATAMKNNVRLISVVMGEDSIENRSEDTLKLLNYGFNTIKKEVIIKKEDVVDEIKFNLADKAKAKVYVKNSIEIIKDTNSSKTTYTKKLNYNKIKLPIKKDEKLGTITINMDDGSVVKEDLIIKKNINKISFFKLLKRNINIFTSSIL